jgi:hypothetical protein
MIPVSHEDGAKNWRKLRATCCVLDLVLPVPFERNASHAPQSGTYSVPERGRESSINLPWHPYQGHLDFLTAPGPAAGVSFIGAI